jgi:hypothetical protein
MVMKENLACLYMGGVHKGQPHGGVESAKCRRRYHADSLADIHKHLLMRPISETHNAFMEQEIWFLAKHFVLRNF